MHLNSETADVVVRNVFGEVFDELVVACMDVTTGFDDDWVELMAGELLDIFLVFRLLQCCRVTSRILPSRMGGRRIGDDGNINHRVHQGAWFLRPPLRAQPRAKPFPGWIFRQPRPADAAAY